MVYISDNCMVTFRNSASSFRRQLPIEHIEWVTENGDNIITENSDKIVFDTQL